LSEAYGFLIEYVQPQHYAMAFCALCLPLLFWLTRKKQLSTQDSMSLQTKALLIALIAIIYVQAPTSQQLPTKHWFVSHSISSYLEYEKQFAIMQSASANTTQTAPAVATVPSKQTLVLIIGESETRNHMGIYGYPRNTTPLLAKEQELFAFKNVISSNAHTIASLSKALTFADLHNQIPHANVLQILNSAGFVTYWLSTQPRLGISETTISLIANTATHKWYSSQHALAKDAGKYRPNYDEILLGELEKALATPAEKKAIVLHLMGNHSPYSYRFPDQFNIFNGIAPEFDALTYDLNRADGSH
jgi:heptose-I-phosphate ethanolaminephosphotransferase